MESEPIMNILKPYDCLYCHRKAHLPVLTRCSHLFCWKCFHLQTVQQERCPLCGQQVSRNDVYPLFVENEPLEAEDVVLPQRPPPVNIPKIPNANIVASNNSSLAMNRNNIAMGRPFAGTLFVPALAVTTFNQMGQPEESEPEKPISFRLKGIFISCVAILIVIWFIELVS